MFNLTLFPIFYHFYTMQNKSIEVRILKLIQFFYELKHQVNVIKSTGNKFINSYFSRFLQSARAF